MKSYFRPSVSLWLVDSNFGRANRMTGKTHEIIAVPQQNCFSNIAKRAEGFEISITILGNCLNWSLGILARPQSLFFFILFCWKSRKKVDQPLDPTYISGIIIHGCLFIDIKKEGLELRMSLDTRRHFGFHGACMTSQRFTVEKLF